MAINRWTENIYILKSYLKNTFQMENDVFEKSFNIPQDLDYLDWWIIVSNCLLKPFCYI